jgi:hypothetical protein
MRYSVCLVEIKSGEHRKIIVKRLASDLSIDLKRAEIVLSALPITLMKGASSEDADKFIFDYERLGCVMRRLAEEQPRPDPPVKSEPPAPAQAAPAQKPPTIRHADDTDARFLVRRRRIRQSLYAGAVVLLLGGALFMSSFLLSKRETGVAPSRNGNADPAIIRELAKADREPEPERKIGLLNRALKGHPNDRNVMRRLSGAYADRANADPLPTNRVKFYQVALSFNPRNRAAWDGLVSGLDEAGKPDEARKAESDREDKLKDEQGNLSRLFSSMANLEEIPEISGNTITLSIRTDNADPVVADYEGKLLAEEVRDARPFEKVVVKIKTPSEKIVREY